MTPYKQLIMHDPDNGQYGDCFRTAVACLLDIEPEKVPHVCHDYENKKDADAVEEMNRWLMENYGLYLAVFMFQTDKLENVLFTIGHYNPDIHYLLVGKSRIGVPHNVVCKGDKIVHDPSPRNTGIVGPCEDGIFWINILAKCT